MALVLDAVGSIDFYRRKPFAQGRISESVLEEVFLDLDHDEVISIIFLMTNIATDIFAVINSLKNNCKDRFLKISKERNWEEKFLEALITIENINVIKKLGFNNQEIEAMKKQYFYDIHNVSENLNRVVKSLYFVCKELTDSQVEKLVKEVYKDLKEPVLHLSKEKMLLEIYILDWLQKKYISIDSDNPELNQFIDVLKTNGLLLSSLDDFKSWKDSNNQQNKNRKNQQDSSNGSGQSLQLENAKNSVNTIKCNKFPWKDKNHKRLCIIVNQVEFTDKSRYVTRIGSDKDEAAITNTFGGLGFKIEKRSNMTAPGMIELLNSLNEEKYRNYAAVFLFILSHGKEGEVIFSDDKSVTLEKIQEKICQNLESNVFKFIILQSCQGKNLGFVDTKLTTDSPVHLESNRLSTVYSSSIYQNFSFYLSTVNKYASVRHETEGSWFIQDACDELRKTTPIKLTEWVQNVNKRVLARKAESNSKDKYIIQVPCLKEYTISEDYVFPKYNNNP